ncbi:AMP-binding protein [Corynebacterium alimapuense]|uniref:Acyl-CoA synthetase n=1 Tax=Corynebacterium alimapuense TaxID=1576874 RepID=A0A3M8K765_9CORY|nr:AMP-binding protein [Corynebacterium alimapuense]RNE48996.1 acyl-CoA synthetase [Corynebacterium alimapuense]
MKQTAFTAKAITKFIPALVHSRILHFGDGLSATFGMPINLARYWFTTAREVEQGHLSVPHRIALIDDDGQLTYRQLREESQTLARYLIALNLGEIRLGIMARNGRGIVCPLTAKGYAGATVFLLNIGSSPEQLAGVIAENAINVLVIDDEFLERLPADRAGLQVILGHLTGPHSGEVTLNEIVSHPDKTAETALPRFPQHGPIVLMSSGTTGIPKGVVRPEPRLPLVLAGILQKIPWHSDMSIQLTASIFHTWGWGMLNIALAARGTVVTHRIFDPAQVLEDIDTHHLQAMISSPIFLKQLLEVPEHQDFDTSSLEFILSSGNAISPTLIAAMHERFGPILCNVYGSTELTLASVASMQDLAADPTVSGQVALGTELKILDERGHEVATGVPGRIFLRNSTTLTGYTNPDIPITRAQGLVEMGDLGYLDEQGYLRVLGRVDDMIIVGGENVHPLSVTAILDQMPGLADAFAIGVDDPDAFHRIAVWVVREDNPTGAGLTAELIQDFVRQHLAEHSIPRDVHFIEELPRNATGKVVPRMLPGGD